jgi:hypothetical protein
MDPPARAAVVFEWYGDDDDSKSRGWSAAAAVALMRNDHVRLIDDNLGAVPPEARARPDDLARRAGYRFVPCLAVRDAPGEEVATADPREWLSGDRDAPVTRPLPAALPPGVYRMSLSLRDPAGARPPLRLAIDAPGEDGRYDVGPVAVA